MSSSTVIPGVKREEWTQVTGNAKEVVALVGEMASHAVLAVSGIASRASCDVGNQIDQLAARAGTDINEIGDSMGGSLPHSWVAGNAMQSLAGAVQYRDRGKYLEDQKLSGMANDVTCLIRRNPVPSVLISIGIGWFVARKM